MRWFVIGFVLIVAVTGCSRKKSSLLLERQTRGPIEESQAEIQGTEWQLEPETQSSTKQDIEVTVTHGTIDYLRNLFSKKEIFGGFAGNSPFYPEHLVFYVKIANRSDHKISINPDEFTIVDERGNQYGTLSVDYITAYAEYRKPVSTITRGLLADASPGYFGFSLPVGRMIASKPQGNFALIQRSALQNGYLHPGVVHDGLITFWSPVLIAKQMKLLITNVKTDFDANDFAQTSLEFAFDFSASHN